MNVLMNVLPVLMRYALAALTAANAGAQAENGDMTEAAISAAVTAAITIYAAWKRRHQPAPPAVNS